MTHAIRAELAPRGITVSAAHVGFIDTDMVAHVQGFPKNDAARVAELALDGVAAGQAEILIDDYTRSVKAGLSE
nr:hypothetical protein [uncultured Actinoplanes sp.]